MIARVYCGISYFYRWQNWASGRTISCSYDLDLLSEINPLLAPIVSKLESLQKHTLKEGTY